VIFVVVWAAKKLTQEHVSSGVQQSRLTGNVSIITQIIRNNMIKVFILIGKTDSKNIAYLK